MNIYLSHISAWQFWIWWSKTHAIPLRLFHSGECFARGRLPSFSLPTASVFKSPACTKREVKQVLDANGQKARALLVQAGIGTGPKGCLHICVPYAPGRHGLGKHIRLHQVGCNLPRRSFVKVAEAVYVASPELTFMQMASVLDLGALCACGMEFAGGYPLDVAYQPDGESVCVRTPVTSQTLLASYADRYHGRGGANKARRAVRHLSDKSASVKETEMALLALLPHRYGGLGAKGALLNDVVALSAEAATIARQKRVVCDFRFEDSNIVVEYDGATHSGIEARTTDSRRRDALRADGYEVLTLTNAQLQNPSEFQAIIVPASRRAGKRTAYLSERDMPRHRSLRSQIARYHARSFQVPLSQSCVPETGRLTTSA